jgi:2-iminobutanoate/2-iminopropanoate deaminase
MANSKSNRRNFIGKSATAAAAVAASTGAVSAKPKMEKKAWLKDPKNAGKVPLFNSAVSYGNLLFLAGIGAHFEGDVKAHTKHVLDEIEQKLKACGSSMEKVLKAQVYLKDINDWAAMNEVFQGRFGSEPPVRTTIAAAGIPGNSLVEIDVIAYI